MHFFNKDLFPMLNKYTIKDLDQDFFDFKTVMEETNIIKSRTYKQAWKNACQIFMDGISLCFDNLFLINQDNKNSSLYHEYCKNKENFTKDVNILFRFEKVINEYYQTYKINEVHLYEPENDINIFCTKDIEKEPLDNFDFDENIEENSDLFSSNTPFSNNYKSDFIFENKKFFINNNFYNKEKNNNFIINNKKTNKNNETISITSNNSNNSNNESTKKNMKQQIIIKNYPKYKSYKNDYRKKKIKEYKFRKLKRENVDKKILRKFKKFLKKCLKEKSENEVKNYINNNGFWPNYISMNLMPPFAYEKENISFKSFNTQYLCWFFDHKFSLELFNIFINIKYDDLLNTIKDDYKLKENSDDFNLLKVYMNSMPMIYGTEIARSTAFSSKIEESEGETVKNINEQMGIEEENSIENNNNNDNKSINGENNDMIIESEINKDNNYSNNNDINNNINFNYINNNINMNNDNINSGHNNYINNNDFIYMNGNNTEMNISPNININENGEINNEDLNNSFENDNPGMIKFNKSLFNII